MNSLLATAMVGTARASLPPHVGTPLADALNRIRRDDAEATLLVRAALTGLAARAGRCPEPAPPLPELAPAETRSEAPPRVTRHLPHLLHSPVLAEWLALCAAAGWRVPHAFLPELLDWGAAVNAELRDTLRPVLGERGRWLAQFSDHWRWMHSLERIGAALDEEAWDAATEAGREALFRTLRAEAPNAGRAFLTTHFRTEKAGVRRRLLEALTQTWDAADAGLEPLLEETLSDRSEDVRDNARRLLQRLPHSAYNARMATRIRALVGQEQAGLLGRLTGQRKYPLTLSDVPDADAKRDGLETVKHPAEHLRPVLNRAHPAVLMTALESSPAELVKLAVQFDAVDELIRAMFTSSFHPAADGSAELAELLLPHLNGNFQHWRSELLALVRPDRRDAELHRALQDHHSQLALDLLRRLPAPWPAALSHEVMTRLRRVIERAESPYAVHEKNSSWDHAWMGVLELARTCAAPDARRPAPLPDDAPEYARQTLDTLYATLDLRARMHTDFAAERTP
ncbi:DUF5691 domain-containing protein [Deinococcus humi]|uniref:Uncharacterized protein n=1 Tax=Deinococcus humi TaxID=662880 RepID=A0A7W8NF72_9DEIO|nr:DUF5691 domain-containing protein [Deinococcus humi]MBB5364126.1 hypothetical protein [Deinococcus humi]GGO32249.1 hypothetical protein GCM10008949_29450 [Deinococcus humi]